jgi:hypothetical protein
MIYRGDQTSDSNMIFIGAFNINWHMKLFKLHVWHAFMTLSEKFLWIALQKRGRNSKRIRSACFNSRKWYHRSENYFDAFLIKCKLLWIIRITSLRGNLIEPFRPCDDFEQFFQLASTINLINIYTAKRWRLWKIV